MKILLTGINAKYIHSNPAVHSLKAFAKDYSSHIQVVEYTINQPLQQLLSLLYEEQPDVIAFSCYIWNWQIITALLKDLPKVLPGVPIWLGGPEVSYEPGQTTNSFPSVTGIMIGEGEQTFRDLCAYYTKDSPDASALQHIPGLFLPSYGYTAPRGLTALDEIPFIYHDLSAFKDRILYYETSRGCPYRCAYCLSAIDKQVRFRSLKLVFQELDFFLQQQVPQVKFIDRTFNCCHEHCQAIWRYLQQHDNGVTNFHFEIAADLLTEEEIDLLSSLRPGLVQLEIGVQTTHGPTLEAINRPCDLKHLRRVVERLAAPGNMHLHLDLIAGLPQEDIATFRRSFNEVYSMPCEDLQLGFLKVLKGSPMAQRVSDYGLIYENDPPYEVLGTRWLHYSDLLELKRVEQMLEIYSNSGQFTATIHQLLAESADAYSLFLALAAYYRQNGYEINQPSRAERLNILLCFAVSRHPENAELYQELLTFDAYARENCKRRPDFARDLSPWKDEIHRIAPRREDHTEVFFYPVWQQDPTPRSAVPLLVSFLYAQRDPRTHNARFIVTQSSTPAPSMP